MLSPGLIDMHYNEFILLLVLPRGLYKLHKAAHTRTIESMLFSNDIGNSFLISRKVLKRLIACST